jgi:hypothetical protein
MRSIAPSLLAPVKKAPIPNESTAADPSKTVAHDAPVTTGEGKPFGDHSEEKSMGANCTATHSGSHARSSAVPILSAREPRPSRTGMPSSESTARM